VLLGRSPRWQIGQKTSGIDAILPSMRIDVVLAHAPSGRRIVIDANVASIVTTGSYRDEIPRSGYLYQMHAHPRSQVD